MDFFSIVCGAASLLWLAAGALAVEDRWRQRRLTKKSEEALDRLLEEVFCDEQDDRAGGKAAGAAARHAKSHRGDLRPVHRGVV